MDEDPRAAPRGGAAARLRRTTPPYALATKMAQQTGRGARLPARARAREPPGRASANSPSSSTSPAASSNAWDVAFYSERLQARALHVSRGGAAAVLPAAARARRACSRSSRGCSACASVARADVDGVAPGRALLRHPRIADGTPRGGFYPRPVRAPEEARRRVDGRLRGPHPDSAARAQLPVAYLVCNFTAAGRAASRRCSRTTTW